MSQAHMLTRHRDIQDWVNDRHGRPAIARVRDRFGGVRAQLKLRFARVPEGAEQVEMSPCSWTAWLAELDRQQLALKVEPSGDCALVARQVMN